MSDGLHFTLDRAHHYSRIGLHAQAIEAWRDVLSEDPGMAEAHAGLANSLFQERRIVAARVEAKRALELDAELTEPFLVMALCGVLENRRKRGLAHLDRVLELEPLNAEAHRIRAAVMRDAGRWTEAEEAMVRALELEPLNRDFRIEEARLAQVQGQSERAEAIVLDLLASNPGDVDALVILGTIQRKRGDTDEAYTLAMSALAVDASDPTALELLASVKLSRNIVGGLFWHATRLIQQVGERRLIWLLWLIYVGYLMVLTTMRTFAVSETLQDLFVLLYIAFWIGLYVNRSLIDRMVRKELTQFRFSRTY